MTTNNDGTEPGVPTDGENGARPNPYDTVRANAPHDDEAGPVAAAARAKSPAEPVPAEATPAEAEPAAFGQVDAPSEQTGSGDDDPADASSPRTSQTDVPAGAASIEPAYGERSSDTPASGEHDGGSEGAGLGQRDGVDASSQHAAEPTHAAEPSHAAEPTHAPDAAHAPDPAGSASSWPHGGHDAPPFPPSAADAGHTDGGAAGANTAYGQTAAPYVPPVQPAHEASRALVPVGDPASNASAGDGGTGAGDGGLTPVYVGDIMVARDAIRSPMGVIPTQGAQVFVHNRTHITSAIPTWAIVLAIVGFFIVTVFSLFFLLAKEQRLSGGYEVVVTGPNGTLQSFVPVSAQNAAFVWNDLQARAASARALIASV